MSLIPKVRREQLWCKKIPIAWHGTPAWEAGVNRSLFERRFYRFDVEKRGFLSYTDFKQVVKALTARHCLCRADASLGESIVRRVQRFEQLLKKCDWQNNSLLIAIRLSAPGCLKRLTCAPYGATWTKMERWRNLDIWGTFLNLRDILWPPNPDPCMWVNHSHVVSSFQLWQRSK